MHKKQGLLALFFAITFFSIQPISFNDPDTYRIDPDVYPYLDQLKAQEGTLPRPAAQLSPEAQEPDAQALFALHETGDPDNIPPDFEKLIDQILKNTPRKVAKEIKNIIKRLASDKCPNHIKPKKLLMTGPSGVGKTTIAKGIAFLSGRPYILIRAPQILTKFQFSGAEGITQLVKAILALNKSYVIIVDEINALTDRFDRDQQADKETATALWLALDECAKRDDILFIGTTNETKMPPPLKTRFKNHILEIPLPDSTGRKNIINFYLKDVNHRINAAMLNRLAAKAHGLSGRELEDMMIKAIQFAFDRNPQKYVVTYRDIDRALQNIRPHGPLVTAIVDAWDNKKEIAESLSPYMPAAGFGLNVVQTALNEKNAWNQQASQEKSYQLQQESFAHQKYAHRESHGLAQRSFAHQQKAHKESYALSEKGHNAQESERGFLRRFGWIILQGAVQVVGTYFGKPPGV